MITPLIGWLQLSIMPYLLMVQKKKDTTHYKVSLCYLHKRNLWHEKNKDNAEPCIIMTFCSFVISIMRVYLHIYFYPTFPLLHIVLLRPKHYTSCVCPSVILAIDIEETTQNLCLCICVGNKSKPEWWDETQANK